MQLKVVSLRLRPTQNHEGAHSILHSRVMSQEKNQQHWKASVSRWKCFRLYDAMMSHNLLISTRQTNEQSQCLHALVLRLFSFCTIRGIRLHPIQEESGFFPKCCHSELVFTLLLVTPFIPLVSSVQNPSESVVLCQAVRKLLWRHSFKVWSFTVFGQWPQLPYGWSHCPKWLIH